LVGNCDYKATSVAIAIASLTELGKIHEKLAHFITEKLPQASTAISVSIKQYSFKTIAM
jgi:hypothetical protein